MRTPELWAEYQQIHKACPDPQGPLKVDFFSNNSSAVVFHNSQPAPEMAIIIPAYNESALVGRSLAGVNTALQHEQTPTQVIVVDNGSTDQTAEIAQFYGAVVVFEQTKRVGRARQTGLEAVSPSVRTVLTTDADTLVTADWTINHQENLAERNTVCTYGEVQLLPDGEISVGNRVGLVLYTSVADRIHALRRYKGALITGGGNMAFMKEAAIEVGGYNTTYALGEDSDLSLKMSSLGDVRLIDCTIPASARRLLMKGIWQSAVERLKGNLHDPMLREIGSSTYADYREENAETEGSSANTMR